MPTIAAGSVATVYCPLASTITITPGDAGRVSFQSRSASGGQSAQPQEIYSATTVSVSAGDTVTLEAINTDATYTTPAGSDTALSALVSGAWNTAGLSLVEPGNGVTPTASAGAGVTVNSSGFVTVDGEQWFRVNATATSGSNNYFEVNVPTFVATGADTAVLEYQCDPSKGSPMVLYLGTASYSVFATGSRSLSTPSNNDPFQHVGRTAATIHKSLWNKNATFTRDTIEQAWVVAKLRVSVTNGETQDFYLRSIRVGVAARKGRLCVISDDGYDSFLRLGVPILERFGIPSTMAIISDKVGVTAQGYVTLDQLRTYVAAGNACVPHGPIGGSDNLYTTYTTNAQRIADMNVHRDYLLTNGLTDARGAQCYVWPQGRYSNGSGEVSLLDAAYEAGYRLARAATAYPSKSGALPMHVFSLANVSARSHSRLCLPIIGHDYNGASNTADDANETTNVNRIITTIQDLADSGLDAFLMLHKVVARGAATSGGIEIETDRLNAIAAAIQAQVAAGKLQPVTMPELLPR